MDFLSSRNDAAIRKELIGIRDSYHHYWDLLAELLQNSRDAITRKRSSGHIGPFFISVSIDPASNSIEVLDNGVGISPTLLTEMLAPGGGDKGISGQPSDEVGEKGVGLTYAVFSCNDFTIYSKTQEDEACGGSVVNAQRWLNKEPNIDRPSFEAAGQVNAVGQTFERDGTSYPLDSFTKIRVGSIMPPDGDVNIFQMTPPQLRLLLRTRTAIGVTKLLFVENAPSEFDAFLSINAPDGLQTDAVKASFVAPHTLVAASGLVTLQATRDAFVMRADAISRRRYLTGKTVWSRDIVNIEGWNINVYGVMFPDNDALRELSDEVMGVPVSEREETDGTALLQNGIFVGTKGMPTGMRIPPKPGVGRYPAYYKRCFFFVESPHLKFDLGRKSLHYRHVNKLQSAVAQLFSRFEDIAPYQGEARVDSGEPQITPAERRAVSQELWQEAIALPDLNEPLIRYEKHPNSQEAAVAAIFHELIGASVLPQYHGMRTGYGERYDLHALYVVDGRRPLQIVIEFKYTLESLIRDMAEKKKHFNDMDLLVAWDADVPRLAAAGFMLDSHPNQPFEGTTHLLTVPIHGVDPIPVILLRTFLDRRRARTPR